VANVANVARKNDEVECEAQDLAKPPQGQTAPLPEAGADDMKPPSCLWRIHFKDRKPVDVYIFPGATHAEVLSIWPDATKVETFDPFAAPPVVPVTPEQEKMIRRWLALIGETNQDLIDKVIARCRRDVDARDYFTQQAAAALSAAGEAGLR